MESKTVQRLKTADILKGLAVLFMIMVHIMEQFADESANTSTFGKVFYFLGGPFCAPVFLAVMGYFLAVSKSNTQELLKRGFLLFTGGILLNIFRSTHLFITIFYEKYQLDPWFYVFGADILTLAGLSIILIALLRLISKDNLLLYLIFMFLVVGLNSLISFENPSLKYLSGFIAGNFAHSYFPLFPWFAYVISGYVFKLFYSRFNMLISKYNSIYLLIIGLIAVSVVVFSKFAFEIANSLPLYYHHDYRFFGWTIGFMIVYLFLIHHIAKLLQNSIIIEYISWTGKNVTSIYVFQWLIIGNLATALYQTQDKLESILWFFSITLLASLLTLAYLKIANYYKSKNDTLF